MTMTELEYGAADVSRRGTRLEGGDSTRFDGGHAASPGAGAAPDWSDPQQARIVRPLCSAPGEAHQVAVPAGCCDIQRADDLVLLSWWGRGRVRQITIPRQELDRLFSSGLIELDEPVA